MPEPTHGGTHDDDKLSKLENMVESTLASIRELRITRSCRAKDTTHEDLTNLKQPDSDDESGVDDVKVKGVSSADSSNARDSDEHDDMGKTLLTFGKHSGKTFEQCVKQDIQYVKWCMENQTKLKSENGQVWLTYLKRHFVIVTHKTSLQARLG